MPINTDRFSKALSLLEVTDWERFERLCHAFLASEFGSLYAAKASRSGDGGRDGELYSPDKRSNVFLQFSLQRDWKAKIRQTVTRLGPKIRNATLIYVTPLEIGAHEDKIKSEYRGRPTINIYDRSWFLARVNLDENRARAAQELYNAVVTPLLESEVSNNRSGLTKDESRALLFFLEIQRDDELGRRNLTKACYESLVRAALKGTSAEKALSREQIFTAIAAWLPQHDLQRQLSPYINSALTRLQHSVVKHNSRTQLYHLAHEEQERLEDKEAELFSLREGFMIDLHDHIALDGRVSTEEHDGMAAYIARVIETYLHSRGEAFASAVIKENANLMGGDEAELTKTIAEVRGVPRLTGDTGAKLVCDSLVKTFLRAPGKRTLAYLKILSDCYTLFAFLAATPDVQAVTKKLFDQGEIWIDTSLILPALAEYGLTGGDGIAQPFTLLFEQLKATGIKLYVTSDVIEEILSHLHNCVSFARAQQWGKQAPYLASQFILRGGSRGGIVAFVDQFRGGHKPEEDLAEFLSEEFRIELLDCDSLSRIPDEVRKEIESYWQEAKKLGNRDDDRDQSTLLRLAKHDAENYANAIARRSDSGQPWLGYTSWWLTLDGSARRLLDNASGQTRAFIRHQPVMSLDFLMRYITFGPMRATINRHVANPLELYSVSIAESLPLDLLDKADRIRSEMAPLSDLQKRRRITQAVDLQRSSAGTLQATDIASVTDALRTQT